jgi:hypothetical protein
MIIPISEQTLEERTALLKGKEEHARAAVRESVLKIVPQTGSADADEGALVLTRGQAKAIQFYLEEAAKRTLFDAQSLEARGRLTRADEARQDLLELAQLGKAMQRFASFAELDASRIQVPRS